MRGSLLGLGQLCACVQFSHETGAASARGQNPASLFPLVTSSRASGRFI
jgi:solute carrier family 31 (copper transporter), member 1